MPFLVTENGFVTVLTISAPGGTPGGYSLAYNLSKKIIAVFGKVSSV
jgi:hypothetical protein